MIKGNLWNILDDAETEKIEQAAVRLLTKSGARIENRELLDLLEAAGCRVDRASMRGYLTENLIFSVLSRLGNKQDARVEIQPGWQPAWNMRQWGNFPHLLDWKSGERRLATKTDIISIAKMTHQLAEFKSVGRALTCCEIDPRVEPLWTTLAIAKVTTKHIDCGSTYFASSIDYLVRMGEILSGIPNDTSLVSSCDCFIQPLILESARAACFLKKRRAGVPNNPCTMAIAGISGPVTPAGVVALSLAELITGWTLGYLINPELPIGGTIATASLDMRTMNACFSSPEAILQNVATSNIIRRRYGIKANPVVSYTDCKYPGLKATFDKMFGLLSIPFSSVRGIGADGLLSAGQDYSPVQHILDGEINKAIERFWGHFAVNDDTLAVDLIENIIQEPKTNFLDTEHTFAHYQENLWNPKWLDRSSWRGGDIEKQAEIDMLARIDQYCADAIRLYEPPDLDAAKIKALTAIYKEAEKSLL